MKASKGNILSKDTSMNSVRMIVIASILALMAVLCLAIPSDSAVNDEAANPKVQALAEKANELSPPEKTALIAAITSSPIPSAPVIQKGPFSSLIVDARGFGVRRSISPKIRKMDGSEVWGTMSVTADFAINDGIASFVTSMESAKACKRCGPNPLIVKAVGSRLYRGIQNPVVSDADAVLIKEENSKTKFADKCNVIFIVDK